MNVRDSQAIAGILKGLGYSQSDSPEEADLVLINTCSVREKAEHKVFSEVGKLSLMKKKKPELIIGVGGCVAQDKGELIFNRFEDVDLVFGTQVIGDLPHMLSQALEGRRVINLNVVDDRAKRFFPKRLRYKSGVREYVTVMEGCENFCSYCIVPYTRGKEMSRTPEEIMCEVRELAENGTKEIILVGQNVNSYGIRDGFSIRFPHLLEMVCRVENIERVRFITSHPRDFNEELAEKFASLPTLAKHLHLPVQAGSNKILKAMNRGYTVEEYLKKVEMVRALVPEIALSTDIIVGFPGEDDKDFEETIELLKTVEFDSIFSFAFSPRPGTPARDFENQVPEPLRFQRLREVQSLQEEITMRKNSRLLGKVVKVLAEGFSKKDEFELTGRTECNRVVNFKGDESLTGKIVNVKITQVYKNSLKGEVII